MDPQAAFRELRAGELPHPDRATVSYDVTGQRVVPHGTEGSVMFEVTYADPKAVRFDLLSKSQKDFGSILTAHWNEQRRRMVDAGVMDAETFAFNPLTQKYVPRFYDVEFDVLGNKIKQGSSARPHLKERTSYGGWQG